jgi:AraC-like DNA-binding protein
MYENYGRRLTLNEIADQEHLSIYYLSHVIKEATGSCFQELLSFIRVEESEKLLLGTNKKIGAISEESGFSAIRYYIKYFSKWFGMHPLEYRKKYTNNVSSREIHAQYILSKPDEIKKALKNQTKEIFQTDSQDKGSSLTIVSLDLDQPKKLKRQTENGIETLSKELHASGCFCLQDADGAQRAYHRRRGKTISLRGRIKAIRTRNRSASFSITIRKRSGIVRKRPAAGEMLETPEELQRQGGDSCQDFRYSRGIQDEPLKFSKDNILMSYKVKLGNPIRYPRGRS